MNEAEEKYCRLLLQGSEVTGDAGTAITCQDALRGEPQAIEWVRQSMAKVEAVKRAIGPSLPWVKWSS